MSKQTRLIIVHDVLGTLFSLEAPTRALLTHYPDLDPKLAEVSNRISFTLFRSFSSLANIFRLVLHFRQLIIYDWYHATQRDYTNLSINDDYQPISKVFKDTLPRILSQANLKPQESAYPKDIEEVSYTNLYPKVSEDIMKSLGGLTPRPNMVKAFNEIYRSRDLLPHHVEKVDLWGATNGGTELARKLFQNALRENGNDLTRVDLGKGVGVFSCDEVKYAKPRPEVYKAVKEKVGFGKDGNQAAW